MIEINLDKMFNKKKVEWDKQVPIIKVGNEYNCYLSDEIDAPNTYNELCFLLDIAEESDLVILHINTPGGHLDSAFKILASLRGTKANTLAILTGTVASAGTIIALGCNTLAIEPYTQFMIHNYSTGTQGKGHEVMDYINFTDKSLKKTFKEIYGGFLTDKEIVAVIKGKDMWMETDEVEKRWARKSKA